MDIWTESLESGGQIDVIYSYLEKSFDKVLHTRLISKLYSYKIIAEIIKWIESFFINRRRRVRVNCYFSFWRQVLSGFLQGSILRPLIIIYYFH